MIPLSHDFELGRDRTRIKNPADAERQRKTAATLLDRLYHDDPEQRWELQLLADEVGMGKTFVALAVAHSVLAAQRARVPNAAFAGCSQRVLVIAPNNASLATKWAREVRECVRRCSPVLLARTTRVWFAPEYVDRLDDLAIALRRSDGPAVIVTHMGVLAGKRRRLVNYEMKRRFVLAGLFGCWGERFPRDARARLLKGAPEQWPRDPDELTRFSEEELAQLPFSSLAELVEVLRAEQKNDALEAAFKTCNEIATPYTRRREDRFKDLNTQLTDVYRSVCFAGVTKALPLVIVDEAHNWKNGPTKGANGYRGFEQHIAPRVRRALLLTATPFQLHPDEMLMLLKIGEEHLAVDADPTMAQQRRGRLAHRSAQVIRPVLERSARQSRVFAPAWARLPPRAVPGLARAWSAPALQRSRHVLQALATAEGALDLHPVDEIAHATATEVDSDLREIVREGLRLYAYNEDLSQELGVFVVRHRRATDHRLVRVGAEFGAENGAVLQRGDRHLLHAAPGLDVSGAGELPHYLLMRCVSEMKHGKGRTALGSNLTGCYSTLLDSADGRSVAASLKASPAGRRYLDLLLQMVTEAQDPEHPKVQRVVDAVMRNWAAGEKTLIFCFRSQTAKRLTQIIGERIGRELEQRRAAALDGKEALTRLRSRFTRRDGDLIGVGLDRVFWSLLWAAQTEELALPRLSAETFRLEDHELGALARAALRAGVDLTQEHADRVFLHRATEHLIARRLLGQRVASTPFFKGIVQRIADETWLSHPYGLSLSETLTEPGAHRELAGIDERGVHASYEPVTDRVSEGDVHALADQLRERRARARRQGQTSVFDAYATAPSLWLGRDPEAAIASQGDPTHRQALARLHTELWGLTRHQLELAWEERLLVFQGLRRALLRESVLVRLLPSREQLSEESWGDLLVEGFFRPLPGQSESMAHRLVAFVEDLRAADGRIHPSAPDATVESPRATLYDATKLRDARFVALVDGSTSSEQRERVFSGFNSPLLPEVLICTTVGQEGIDLHRHCRHVIHYDLAWNPAVLEQRTGRVDRIGSKTFRERAAAPPSSPCFLDVGVPFLAGTYDERMYEELRIRAQMFEVLTGGDLAADNLEGHDSQPEAEGTEAGLSYPVLPAEMVADLRVKLHVWTSE